MGRPKGSKNKKTIFREQALVHRRAVAAKRASLIRNEPLQEVVAHTSDLDSLLVLEETMRHFYLKARIEELLGKDADWKAVDTAMVEAGRWAREVALYRHARLSAVKLAGDPNEPLIPDNMTLEQLRADIVSEVARLGHVLELDAVRSPQGIENRTSTGPTNGEGEAE